MPMSAFAIAAKDPITKIELEYDGFTAGGSIDDFEVTTDIDSIEIDEWYLLIDTNADGDDSVLDSDDVVGVTGDKFEEGVRYIVQLCMLPEEGYDFDGLEAEGVTMTGAVRDYADTETYRCWAGFILGEFEGGEEEDPVHEHEYDDGYKYNSTYHWKKCIADECDDAEGSIKDKAKHDFEGRKCTVCGYKKPSESSSSGTPSYKIEIEETEDGKVKTSNTYAEKGQKVYITVTPDEGFEIDEITVTDKDGDEIEIKEEDGRYSFTMPKGKVEVEVTFAEIEKEAEKIVLTVDSTVAWVFDEYVVNDVAPVIRNDRTMLPIRFVAEALGAEVAWDDALDKVTIVKDDLEIEIFIGSEAAFVNGETSDLDSPAFIENDRTYLPLRFVAENLGAEVKWNETDRTVTIIPAE